MLDDAMFAGVPEKFGIQRDICLFFIVERRNATLVLLGTLSDDRFSRHWNSKILEEEAILGCVEIIRQGSERYLLRAHVFHRLAGPRRGSSGKA